ncbi:MAG: hypothetical protein ACRCU5_00185 [Rhizobiaceae bacterium]
MAFLFLKRDFPDFDTERVELRRKRRLATALFVVTHGLWLLTSTAALVFAVSDAMPASGQVLLVGQILE